jgi:predicted 3-demethylubiquinone-9 3-methyltransferase (glyoxalase superfamily)
MFAERLPLRHRVDTIGRGRAEEAIEFYTSLFPDSSILSIPRYGPDDDDTEGAISDAEFLLAGELFMALESSLQHDFTSSPAISFLVMNETREEALKDRLAAGGSGNAAGCVTDRFGVTRRTEMPATSPSSIS